MDITYILILSSSILIIGFGGLMLNSRNIIILLMSFEIMYLSATINFAFYTFLSGDVLGLIFMLYALTIIGAESCIGLSLVAVYFAIHKDVSMNTMDTLRR